MGDTNIDSGSPEATARDKIAERGFADTLRELALLKRTDTESRDEWLKSFGFGLFCTIKRGPIGEVLSLLQDGWISRGKAAEAIAELLLGNAPPLPEGTSSAFDDLDIPGEVVTALRTEVAMLLEALESLTVEIDCGCASCDGYCEEARKQIEERIAAARLASYRSTSDWIRDHDRDIERRANERSAAVLKAAQEERSAALIRAQQVEAELSELTKILDSEMRAHRKEISDVYEKLSMQTQSLRRHNEAMLDSIASGRALQPAPPVIVALDATRLASIRAAARKAALREAASGAREKYGDAPCTHWLGKLAEEADHA